MVQAASGVVIAQGSKHGKWLQHIDSKRGALLSPMALCHHALDPKPAMNIVLINLITILLYLAAAFKTAGGLFHDATAEQPDRKSSGVGLALGVAAVVLHAGILYSTLYTASGVNLGVSNAASLVFWLLAVLALATAWRKPLGHLAIILLPLAALGLGLELVFPGTRMLPADAPIGLRIHVLFSLLAYSVLSLAALVALVLAVEDHLLHNRRPLGAMHALPPLQTLERLMFQLIGGGFFLLTLSLFSGFMFLEDIFNQHLAHKTVLSIVAWLVFAILLWGRRRFGWRGRTAIRYTLGGFLSLMLAYFGTKVVLELILDRVSG